MQSASGAVTETAALIKDRLRTFDVFTKLRLLTKASRRSSRRPAKSSDYSCPAGEQSPAAIVSRTGRSCDTDDFFDCLDHEVEADESSESETDRDSVCLGEQREISQAKLDALADYVGQNPVLPSAFFSQPNFDHISLRSKYYLTDSIKIKATRSLLKLVAVDVYATGTSRIDHLAAMKGNRIESTRKGESRPSFMWMVNLQMPSTPANQSLCYYFCPSTPSIALLFDAATPIEKALEIAQDQDIPLGLVHLIREFFFGEDDALRNDRFKMIPYIRDGPWLVRNAIPSKPGLLGRRMPIRSFRGDGYLEMDIDIGGGRRLAKSSTSLGVGYSSMITFDIAFVLEGRDIEELPEELIAIASIKNVDLKTQSLDISSSAAVSTCSSVSTTSS